MTGLEAVALLREHRLRVFTTADFMTLSALRAANATRTLVRLAAQDLVVRLKRGLWANRLVLDLDPCEAVPLLRSPWPAYVSLHSALADYGVVAEVPQLVYAVTPAMPRTYRTALGEFRFHHLPSRLIWGFELRQTGAGHYPMAEREKAFLDLVYLALTPRSPLGLPHKRGRRWELDTGKLTAYGRRFGHGPLEAWLKANGLWAERSVRP